MCIYCLLASERREKSKGECGLSQGPWRTRVWNLFPQSPKSWGEVTGENLSAKAENQSKRGSSRVWVDSSTIRALRITCPACHHVMEKNNTSYSHAEYSLWFQWHICLFLLSSERVTLGLNSTVHHNINGICHHYSFGIFERWGNALNFSRRRWIEA